MQQFLNDFLANLAALVTPYESPLQPNVVSPLYRRRL